MILIDNGGICVDKTRRDNKRGGRDTEKRFITIVHCVLDNFSAITADREYERVCDVTQHIIYRA